MTTTEFDKNITENIKFLRTQLDLLEQQREATDDLGVALTAETIGDLARVIMQDAIGNERANGRTWAQIGDHLNISRQGAQKRFGKQ